VAGKYRIERTIGSGGMGVVMAAHHLALDEPVALKFIGADRALDREAIERLMREARATFRLRSKHAVRVHDVGELPSGSIYIVMELLEGRDLRGELTARGPLPESEVVGHILEACDALDEAHALGIVHRDLKPHNLFLAKSTHGRPMVKVLDFGMSKVDPTLWEAGPLTRPETALGTPKYMAPEQWRSAAEVDARADLWALGVVMYELLTGSAPLQKLTLRERQARMLVGAIPSPREENPEVSEAVARVVMRCLRADPQGRWPSVAHLATALHDALPAAAPQVERVEITHTGLTTVVPAEVVAKRAAEMFAATQSDPRSSVTPPTRPETPIARVAAPLTPRSDDFDATTEVRAPAFTPANMVVEASRAASPAEEKKRMASTLRSPEARPGMGQLHAAPTERTQPMPRPAIPAVPAHAPAPAPSLAPAPAPVLPTAPMAPYSPPRPPRSRAPARATGPSRTAIVLVFLGAVAATAGVLALLWAVSRAVWP
jgi:serine/threonine-protein kinase